MMTLKYRHICFFDIESCEMINGSEVALGSQLPLKNLENAKNK